MSSDALETELRLPFHVDLRLTLAHLRHGPADPTMRSAPGDVWRATDEELRRAPSFPSSETVRTGSDEGMVSYAPTSDDVNRFDPAKATTFRGVVVGTMTASFQQDLEDVLALVDLGNGRTIRARLGPEIYLTQIGLGLAPGQSVVLEGFALEGDDQPLVVVSKITVQDRTFVLRNLDGTPLWTRGTTY